GVTVEVRHLVSARDYPSYRIVRSERVVRVHVHPDPIGRPRGVETNDERLAPAQAGPAADPELRHGRGAVELRGGLGRPPRAPRIDARRGPELEALVEDAHGQGLGPELEVAEGLEAAGVPPRRHTANGRAASRRVERREPAHARELVDGRISEEDVGREPG